MPRIRDYAYNRSSTAKEQDEQALKVTMFEEEVKVDRDDKRDSETEKEQKPSISLVDANQTNKEVDSSVEAESPQEEQASKPFEAPADKQKAEIKSIVKVQATKASTTNKTSNQGGDMVLKVVKAEVDLAPKYSDAAVAIRSIVENGDYYEDYTKGANNGLTQSKEFVLCVIAQNPDRFFSPQTPTPPDWLDEEFVTFELKNLFDRVKEEEDSLAVENISSTLYEYLHKAAFDEKAYDIISTQAKLVAKVASAAVINPQDGQRTKDALNRFFASIKTAKDNVKARFDQATLKATERKEKLGAVKQDLFSMIDITIL